MVKTIIAQFEEYDRRIFWIFLALMAVALFAYVYFLGISVYAVIERRGAEGAMGRLSSKISLLESQYVSLDQHITLELAHAQGFKDVGAPRYITRSNMPHNTLTLREESVLNR